jgi:hypothetical protein
MRKVVGRKKVVDAARQKANLPVRFFTLCRFHAEQIISYLWIQRRIAKITATL